MSSTDTGRLGDVHVTEVEGIPAVWAEAPGEFSGGITFRLGHVDETLITHGITHMIEHLALFGIDRPGEHSNGQVDATTLALFSSGSPDEVALFLTRAARQLVELPVARLEDEKGVLRAEAAGRAPWALAELVAWRWGTRTYGLEAARELGLDAITAEAVREWSATGIGRRNAVLWFTGPPPAGLRLDLPDGKERPAADPYPSPLPAFPAHFVSQMPAVAVHGLVRRTPAAATLASVLRSRLVDDLRTARAAAYSPEVGYRPLTGDVAVIVAFADVVKGREDVVAERLPAALADLVADGPTEEELAARRAELRRGLDMPGFVTARVTTAAWDVLHGGRVQTIDEVLDDADRVTAAEVAACADELRRTALLQIPGGVPLPPDPWGRAPMSPSPPVEIGRRFAWLGGDEHLVVGPDGVTVVAPDSAVTVRHENLAVVGRWDDGGRLLIGTDGVHLTVEPTLWRGGRRAVELIDAAVPAAAVVQFGSRAPDAVPRRPPAGTRLRRRLRGITLATGLAALMIVVPVAIMAALIAAGQGELIPPAIVVTAVLAIKVFLDDSRDGT